MVNLLCLVVLLAACGDAPIEPEQRPAWCSPAAIGLAGQYERQFERLGHSYHTSLVFTQTAPCALDYAFEAHRIADAEHTGGRVYTVRGDVVVTAAESTGPVVVLTLERRRTFVEQIGEADQDTTVNHAVVLYDTEQAKLWGDVLHLWGFQYTRVE